MQRQGKGGERDVAGECEDDVEHAAQDQSDETCAANGEENRERDLERHRAPDGGRQPPRSVEEGRMEPRDCLEIEAAQLDWMSKKPVLILAMAATA
jgi:hypothetical protein